MEKLNTKKIKTFLKEINVLEYRYLELTMQIVSGIKNLIQRYNLTKEEFCELFHIKPSSFENYICGNYNYKLDDMATLNYVYQKLETEKVKEEDLITIGVEK